jgi:hypothetical protein
LNPIGGWASMKLYIPGTTVKPLTEIVQIDMIRYIALATTVIIFPVVVKLFYMKLNARFRYISYLILSSILPVFFIVEKKELIEQYSFNIVLPVYAFFIFFSKKHEFDTLDESRQLRTIVISIIILFIYYILITGVSMVGIFLSSYYSNYFSVFMIVLLIVDGITKKGN